MTSEELVNVTRSPNIVSDIEGAPKDETFIDKFGPNITYLLETAPIKHLVPETACQCHFVGWRDNEVCLMHLKAGYGKYFNPKEKRHERPVFYRYSPGYRRVFN